VVPRQEASYRISVRLTDSAGTLVGTQQLEYLNRSHDSLRVLVFQLPLNGRRGLPRTTPQAARGYTRLGEVRSGGDAVALEWPLSPDSSLVRLLLSAPLPPGGATRITMDWESRPPAAAAGAGHFDYAHWYPRLAAYGPRGWPEYPFDPDAESFGEFATYLVRMDLPLGLVVGATGLPACGDPGWAAARRPVGAQVHWWYFSPRDSLSRARMDADSTCAGAAPGRKTVAWRAENVPDFAFSVDPGYRYEEGDFQEQPVRVFYRAGQEVVWGAGLVARRSETALAWLQQMLGTVPTRLSRSYPWPQTTSAQQLAPGPTAPPMLALADVAGLDTVVHLYGRNYFGGIVANDGWNERWLGEGLVHFQAAWYLEVLGRRGEFDALESQVLGWDLDGLSEPVAGAADAFRDRATWLAMTGDRAELFFHQLRTAVGGDSLAKGLLQHYFQAYTFRRADEAGLLGLANASSGQDLTTFFRQWLHETVLYDYAVGTVTHGLVPGDGGAGWATDVEVVRKAPGEFPVEVWVIAESDTAAGHVRGTGASEVLTLATRSRPTEIRIDPRGRSHDWNMLNNRRSLSNSLLPPSEKYLGGYFGTRSERDVLTMGVAPTAWYNQEGGWTLGLKARTDYLGRFDLDEAYLNMSTGWSADPQPGSVDVNASIRLSNPTWLRAPGVTEWVGASWVEGRAGAGVGVEKSFRRSLADSAVRIAGLSLEWLTVRSPAYVDAGYYDDAGTVELTGRGGIGSHVGAWRLDVGTTAALGYMYANAGTIGIPEQGYFRGTLSATARRPIAGRMSFGARAYAGAVLGGSAVVRQRKIFLSGSDPYQQYADPFLRSRGSILRLDGVNYQSPGGTGVRGLAPTLSAEQAYGLNLELERFLVDMRGGMVRRVAIAAFADGALANGDLDRSGGNALQAVADAGLGVRVGMQMGQTPFELRFDLPLWVSEPALAQDSGPGTDAFGFRWTFSFSPVF